MRSRLIALLMLVVCVSSLLGVVEGERCRFGTNLLMVYNRPESEQACFNLGNNELKCIVCQASPDNWVTYTLYHCHCEKGDPSPEMDICRSIQMLISVDKTIFDDIDDMQCDQGCIYKTGGGGEVPDNCSRESNSTGCEPVIAGTCDSGSQSY